MRGPSFKGLGLTGRTTGVLLIFIIIGYVLALRLSFDTLRATYESYLDQSMKRMARQTCASVMEPVVIGDYRSVKGILESMVTGQEVGAIEFMDSAGHAVRAQAHIPAAQYPAWFGQVVSLRREGEASSALVVGGRTYGECRVFGAQVEFKNVAWKEFTRVGLIWGATGLGIILALVYIIQGGLRPLKRAIAAIERDERVGLAVGKGTPPEIRQAVLLLKELKESYGGGAIGRAVDTVHEQLTQFQQAINQAALVVETDSLGVIRFVNEGVLSLAAGEEKIFADKVFWEVFGGTQEMDFALTHFWKREITLAYQQTIYILAVWAFPLRAEGELITKWLIIGNDVTEFKNLQSDMQAAMRERGAMLTQLTYATEDERRRIARELHDEMGQRLVSLMMDVDMVGHYTDPENLKGKAALLRLRENAQSTYRQVNDMIDKIRPPLLESLSLKQSLQAIVDQWAARMSGVEFQVNWQVEYLSNALEVAIFRIVQEACTNIAKHAREVSRVEIALQTSTAAAITLRVENDGVVGDYSGAGTGLKAMRERAIALGGTFAISAGAAGGTCIIVTLPASAQ